MELKPVKIISTILLHISLTLGWYVQLYGCSMSEIIKLFVPSQSRMSRQQLYNRLRTLCLVSIYHIQYYYYDSY